MLAGIQVAVLSTGGDDAGMTAIVSQLNNDTYFDFDAELVTAAEIDSVSELNAYRTVVIGNNGDFPDPPGTGGDEFATVASALRTWVEGGGGLVATGWTLFGTNTEFGSEAAGVIADLDAIVPVDITNNTYIDLSPGGGTLDILALAHPVTAGVGDIAGLLQGEAASVVTPDAGATVLGTYTAPNDANGKIGAVAGNPGSGASVYLGPIYSGSSIYDTTQLRSGDADRLLAQAVAWAASDILLVTPVTSPTPADNDYTRINNAIQTAADGESIILSGLFNWTEPNAAASWALGSDGIASTADDYSIKVPQGLENVTFTASGALGTATIQGPGDLASVNLESFLEFAGATVDATNNQGWTISNLTILDFDLGIGLFSGGADASLDQYDGTTISGNRIRIANDLNSVVAPADTNQNIGIHYAFGDNQTISGNVIEIPGDGVSDPSADLATNRAAFSSVVGMQSNTNGAAYDGLLITGNTINVLNAQNAANPQRIIGIWENGNAIGNSDITVSNNTFNNLAAGNDPTLNLQQAFWVTSHSGVGGTVTYSGNTVRGAQVGIKWAGDPEVPAQNYSGLGAVQVTGNLISNSETGILIQNGGAAILSGNNFDGGANPDNGTDVLVADNAGTVTVGATANSFAGDAYYINNQSAQDINLSSTAQTYDVTDNFRIEDRMFHKVDDLSSGLITWVADNLFVTAPGTASNAADTDSSIQRGVDAAPAGDTVNVEAGTFTQTVEIDQSVTLMGAGAATIVMAPAMGAVLPFTSSGNNRQSVISVIGATGGLVTIKNLTVDGAGQGATVVPGNDFHGIGSDSSDVTIDAVTVKGVRDATLSGAQRGRAIFAGNDAATPHTVTVQNSTVIDYQKGGIDLRGAGLTANVTGNTITGAGASTIIAQNGVVLVGSTGTISGNTITGHDFTGTPAAAGAGIVLSGTTGTVNISSNTLTSNETQISTNSNANITQNSITGGTGSAISAVTNPMTLSVTNNFIQNNVTGVNINGSVGAGASITVENNSIQGNTTGLRNASASTVDASPNWWGDVNGPARDPETDNPWDVYVGTMGDEVDGPVDFTPWLTSGTDTSAAPGFQPNAVDMVAPAAPSTPDLDPASDGGPSNTDNNTNDATPTFNGTTEAGALVLVGVWDDSLGSMPGVVENGEVTDIASDVADGSGNYSATVGPLGEGTYQIVARAIDQAGNQGPWSGALTVVIDTAIDATTVDLATISDSTSPNTDPAGTNTDNITNINTPTFTGTADPNASIVLFDGATPIGNTTADGSGNWTITLTTPNVLSNGAHVITATATDAFGNTSTSAPLNVVVDTAVTANSIPDMTAATDDGSSDSDNITTDNTPTFTGTTEPGAYVELLVNGVVVAVSPPGGAGDLGPGGNADGSGVWTLTPVAAIPDGTHTIAARVTDIAGNVSTSGTLSFTIDTINDAPVADDDVASTTEETPVIIDVLDGDNAGPAPEDQTLTIVSVTNGSNGSVVINDQSTLDPSDDTVTYTPNANFVGTDTFTYTVEDSLGAQDTATVTVTVTNVNDNPTAMDDAATVAEDSGATVINVLANDDDAPDTGETLTVTAITQPTNGTATLSGGVVSYTPNANFFGTDTFTYTISDGNGGTDTATVTMTVTAVNDAPVAGDDPLSSIAEDSGVRTISFASLLGNDSPGPANEAGQTLTITSVANPVGGTVSISGTNVLFTPTANYNGPASFEYTVSDGAGGTDVGSVSFTITPVNDAPVAVDDTISTQEDTAISVNESVLLGNDTDADMNTLDVTAVGNPTNGTVTLVGNTITFTPTANFVGTATFEYTVTDGTSTDTGLVTVNVTTVNDPPNAADDSATVAEDSGATVINVLGNDSTAPDVGETLTVSSVTQGTNGTVTNNGTNVSYTPNANFFGTDTFTYTVNDGNGGMDTATVTVTVTAVNDAPIANNDGVGTPEETPVIINVKANDTDVDDASGDLDVDIVTGPSSGTAVENVDGSITYTPNANFVGTDSFTYTLTDPDSAVSNTATVTIVVGGANDAPVAADDTNSASDDGVPVTGNVLGNDTDPDGPGDVLSVNNPGTYTGTFGTLTLNADGTYSYVVTDESIPAGFVGSDIFNVTITDGEATDASTLTITVNGLNDAPVAADDVNSASDNGVPAAGNVLTNDSDVDDGAALVVSNPGSYTGTFGTLTLNANGTYSYVVTDESLQAGDGGPDVFNVIISDGTATDVSTLTITVTGVNDAPVANNDSATTTEDAAVTIPVLTNDTDVDGDALTVTGVSSIVGGTAAIVGNAVQFMPSANFNGTASFDYTVDDGNGGTDVGSVTVTVTAVNDAPNAVDDVAATNEETAVIINVKGNDSDVDNANAQLTVTAATDPANGTVVVNGDGTITYTPDAGFIGTDTFVYTLQDPSAAIDTATVTVTVSNVNDAPVAVDDVATTAEETPVAINVTGNDTDVDNTNAQLTVTGITGLSASEGTATFAGGTVTFTPAVDFVGTAIFDYTVSDGAGGTDVGQVTVTVTNVNDNPTAMDDAATVAEDSGATVINVLGNDDDAPDTGETLTVTGVTQGANGGTVTFTAGNVSYTPASNFFGTDTFTYTISDGNGGTDTATVTVTVTNVNDNPMANDDAATVAEDSGATVIDVLANDDDAPDTGETLTISAVTQGANGTVVNNGTTVSYTPAANFVGTDTFTYTISDGNGGLDTATVSVTVTNVNDNPVANDDVASTTEDSGPIVIPVLANDNDGPDVGETLTVSAVSTPSANGGTVTTNGTTVSYTPAPDFVGTDTFTYTLSDGNGGTDTATVTVTVSAVTPTFRVVSFTPTDSGFDVTFNRALDLTELNLYDSINPVAPGPLRTPDIVVTGSAVGSVKGSVVYDPDTFTLSWVKTGVPLVDDVYTVTLVSGDQAFEDTIGANGNNLDGNADGIAGDNYTVSFDANIPGSTPTISLPDFARGPGQSVDLTAGDTTDVTLPVRVTGTNVLGAQFELVYDTALLTINPFVVGGVTSTRGGVVTANQTVDGNGIATLSVTLSGSTPYSGTENLFNITASVPSTAAYQASQVLRLQNSFVNEDAALDDAAIQKVMFPGDANGSGLISTTPPNAYTGEDATLISRVIVNISTGFDATPLVDPVIVGDASGNGTLSNFDATLVLQEASGTNTPQVPDETAPGVGVAAFDPELSIEDVFVNVGGDVTIPVNITIETSVLGIVSATYTVKFDSAVLDYVSTEHGDDFPASSGWAIAATETSPGTVQVAMSNANVSSNFGGAKVELAKLNFEVLSSTPGVSTELDIDPVDPNELGLIWTNVDGSATATFSADFDRDGDVDGDDLSNWQAGFGTQPNATVEQGDEDRDGDVDGRDFLAWQRQAGSTLASVAETASGGSDGGWWLEMPLEASNGHQKGRNRSEVEAVFSQWVDSRASAPSNHALAASSVSEFLEIGSGGDDEFEDSASSVTEDAVDEALLAWL